MTTARSSAPRHLLDQAAPQGWRLTFSPRRFYSVIGRFQPWLAWGTVAAGGVGLIAALGTRPPASHSAILFIHVPSAWLSIALFVLVAFCALVGTLLRAELFSMMAQALVPTGTVFALIALATGSLWGKPGFGSWWDARYLAELLLLLLYVAILLFRFAFEDPARADRVVAVVALGGLTAIPAALKAAYFWRSYHLPSLHSLPGDSAPAIEFALTCVTVALGLYATTIGLMRLRCVILERLRQSDWLSPPTGTGP